MLGIVGWIVGGVGVSKAEGKTVGETVERTLSERFGLIIGKRVKVETVGETVAGNLVGDEDRVRLEAAGIFVEAEEVGVSETGIVDVRERMTLEDDEEALLEDTGRTVDREKATLDRMVDFKVRGVVEERVANVDGVVGTSDGEMVVPK